MEQIEIRRMTAADVPALAAIERECFSVPWSAQALAEELEQPHAVFLVAHAPDGTVLGYAGMHHVGDEGFIANVATAARARRQGVARALLAALDGYARANALCRLTLEVRPSNAAAIALYTGAGFTCDGLRPHFYTAPDEAAAIYSKYYDR